MEDQMPDKPDEVEAAIDEVLGGSPRSSELEEMISALVSRRASFQMERDAAKDSLTCKEWETRLKVVDKQIATLREERAITQFVENEVRIIGRRPGLETDWD